MMSTDEVSSPNFPDRNAYERSSRLVPDNDNYIRRTNNNNNNNTIYNNNSYHTQQTASTIPSLSPTVTGVNRGARDQRESLYASRNGPHSTANVLGERSTNNITSNSKQHQNSRIPSSTSAASWYEAATVSTNGPGGSGNVGASAAGGSNNSHYHQYVTTGVAHPSSTSISSPPASSILATTPPTTATATTITATSSIYQRGGVHDSNLSNSKQRSKLNKLLKASSAGAQSQSQTSTDLESPMSTKESTMSTVSASGTATATTTALTTVLTSTPTSTHSNSSCSTISNSSNNISSSNNLTTTTPTGAGAAATTTISGGNSILNAMHSLSSIASGYSGSSNQCDEILATTAVTNGCPSLASTCTTFTIASNNNNNINSAASNSATRTTHHHGRSTTSSSRSHSRSPSSYSSSHSSTSSSHASSRSHASSPILGSDIIASSSSLRGVAGRSQMQSAIATPTQGASLSNNPSGGCSSSSSSSSGSCTATTPVVHSEDNRPLAIRVRNLPARSSDTSLKDGLFHEYKKHGKVTWVKVVGQNSERYALVCFKKPDDVEKALEVSHDKLFFGCKIEVEPYQGYDVEDNEFRPYEAELDEYHPKSTRTLFIGNLEKEITASELRSHFECFGEIIEIDIKKQGMNAYAFCQYSDIVSVVKAMRKMDGEHLGNNRIKLGFGKSMPTNCVWIDGIGEKISESHLQSQFSRYGAVTKVVIDRVRQLALVLYEQIQYAQTAVKEMRGTTLRGRRLQVDFASRECQDAFYEKLDKQSTAIRFSRYDSQSRSRASSFSRHQNSNDGCSPSNTPGSSSGSSVTGGAAAPPTLSSAIVTSGISTNATSGTTSGLIPIGQTTPTVASNLTPARNRIARNIRSNTIDFDYADVRRFRAYDEYSQGSGASHDEDLNSATPLTSLHSAFSSGVASSGLRSDSPLLSRLGPIVGSAAAVISGSEDLTSANGRRRCDKSPTKQKGDIRVLQKERFHLLEQLEECPSSGDENISSPRKRIKIDHHHSNNLTSGLLLSSQDALNVGETHKNNLNLNCDSSIHDPPLHRKADVRRLSDFGKYHHQQTHSQHYHQSQHPNLIRRPSNDLTIASTDHTSARHNSTGSSSSEHYNQHQFHSSTSLMNSTTVPCKRRRVVGSSNNCNMTSSAAINASGSSSNVVDDFHHHPSRGRGHPLHSHHSHEASCGESADGSRPGTPLCDERPEVLPTEPRRVPRERPQEPMVLPLPKFGVQFYQQFRNSAAGGVSNAYHHHHSMNLTSTSSGSVHTGYGASSSQISGISGGNSHSSLNHNLASVSTSGGHLNNASSRYSHWRPHSHSHPHHHGQANPATSTAVASDSPLRSRSLSSNSSDSEAQGQLGGSPSLEERIRTLDEMYERWSGGSTTGSNIGKRSDFSHSSTSFWQSHRNSTGEHSSSSLHAASATTLGSPTTPLATSRHKFLDLDVNEMQPSDIVKSVLAKKSIFDDDLQRLKKNQWYEPTSNDTNPTTIAGSIGLPNLSAANKSPIIGASNANSALNRSTSLLQRLSSLSPMNSPQASMSPYNSPSPSPSVGGSFASISSSSKQVPIAPAIVTPTASSASASVITAAANATTKGLQYPFPSHPPLPNTAAPAPSVQPPPPTEQMKIPEQPPLPPFSSENIGSDIAIKPKPNIIKSLSVPSATSSSGRSGGNQISSEKSSTSKAVEAARVLTKSVSVPGSTNVGTVKTKSFPDSTNTTGISSSTLTSSTSSFKSVGHTKSENDNQKTSKSPTLLSSVNSTPNNAKKSEKSHKHNRNDSEKKSKHEKSTERRKKSLTSTSRIECEDSSDSDASNKESENAVTLDSNIEKDKTQQKEKERIDREKREREMKKQQEKEERELRLRGLDQEKIDHVKKEEKDAHEVRENNDRKIHGNRELKLEQENRFKDDRVESEKMTVKEDSERQTQKNELVKMEREKENSSIFSTFLQMNEKPTTAEKYINKDDSAIDNATTVSPALQVTTKHHHSGHKNTRSSPTRHPKRRLSSQDSNNGLNTIVDQHSNEDHAKRARTDNISSVQHVHSKESHTKEAAHRSSSSSNKHHHHHHKHHSSTHKSDQNVHSSSVSASASASSIVDNSTTGEHEKSKNKEHSQHKYKNKHHSKATVQLVHHSTDSKCTDNLYTQIDSMATPTQRLPSESEKSKHYEDINSDQEQNAVETLPLKPISTDDEEYIAAPKVPSQHSHHKHREHHHHLSSKHKSKRDHREKKRHSLTESTTTGIATTTDDEHNNSAMVELHRRTSTGGGSTTSENAAITATTPISRDMKAKTLENVQSGSGRNSVERKLSRCSDDGSVSLLPNTPTCRQSGIKPIPSRKMIMSSADSDDSEDTAAAKKRSIFEVPSEGPYVSMYDKVKARSCKNMQKQEEEKKIRAKFSQLKQCRAKREEKKRSTSYDGDSDSEYDDQLNHRESSSCRSRNHGGLTSSSDGEALEEEDNDGVIIRRRSSQASSSHRKFSDSDSTTAEDAARRIRMHENLMRLCDGGDTSEDEIRNNARRMSPNKRCVANKRIHHAVQRIASDSESQSQPTLLADVKIKQEPIAATENEEEKFESEKKVKNQIKNELTEKELDQDHKFKRRTSIASIDGHHRTMEIKTEPNLPDIKKEYKVDFCHEGFEYSKLKTLEQEDEQIHQTPDSTRKKHKKSKKRQKSATGLIDSIASDAIMHHIGAQKLEMSTNEMTTVGLNDSIVASLDERKCNSPKAAASLDIFDELKRQGIVKLEPSTPTTTTTTGHLNHSGNLGDLVTTVSNSEKKRHKERKEKKREKLRSIAGGGENVGTQSVDIDRLNKEERHRLKKAKKSKSLEVLRDARTSSIGLDQDTPPQQQNINSYSPTNVSKRIEGQLEDIFGPLSDEESQFSEIECKEPTIIGNKIRNACSSTPTTPAANISAPNASVNLYKQEPLTPKSHTVEENEENILKVGFLGGNGTISDAILNASSHNERERLRKEKREKKRRERAKSREQHALSALQQQKQQELPEDENSVDLDEAGRALEAQLMEDFDNKVTEDATPSTATTFRSDMTDVFRFSDGDENSVEFMPTPSVLNKTTTEGHLEHTLLQNVPEMSTTKQKEKKKKKKRSKDEKHHHQRRESSCSSNNSSTPNLHSTVAKPSVMSPPLPMQIAGKLTIDVQAATKHSQKLDKQTSLGMGETEEKICKPSPSLPCLIDDDDDLDLCNTKLPVLTTTSSTSTSSLQEPQNLTGDLSTSPMREKNIISPIPKTPTTAPVTQEKICIEPITPVTPMAPMTPMTPITTITPIIPITSTAAVSKAECESTVVNCDEMVREDESSSKTSALHKKKPEKFIPGFDGELDDKISESAVQSISAELSASLLDPIEDEPKIPIQSPPNALQHVEKLDDTKSRVQISQEETESAVSALLGESFGNSSTTDFDAYNDVGCIDDLSSSAVVDEEAAIAARAIESSLKEANSLQEVDEDHDEVNMAIQSLGSVVDMPDIKPPDTPQSERGLQIDTDTEDTNADEADSSGNSLKIDESRMSISPLLPTVVDKCETMKAEVPSPKSTQTPKSVITKVDRAKVASPINIIGQINQPPEVSPLYTHTVDKFKELPPAEETSKSKLPSMVSLEELPSSFVETPISASLENKTLTHTSILFPNKQGQSPRSVVTSAELMQPPTINIPEIPPHFVVSKMGSSPRSEQVHLSPRQQSSPSIPASQFISQKHSPLINTATNVALEQQKLLNSPKSIILSPTPVQRAQQLPQQIQQVQPNQVPAANTANLTILPQSPQVQLSNTSAPNLNSIKNNNNNNNNNSNSKSPDIRQTSSQNVSSQSDKSGASMAAALKQPQVPTTKSVIEHCSVQHATVHKMPSITAHSTIISKVVNLQPQHAQQLPSPTRHQLQSPPQQQKHHTQAAHITPILSMQKTITNPYMQQQQQQQQQHDKHFASVQQQSQQSQQHSVQQLPSPTQQKIQQIPSKIQQSVPKPSFVPAAASPLQSQAKSPQPSVTRSSPTPAVQPIVMVSNQVQLQAQQQQMNTGFYRQQIQTLQSQPQPQLQLQQPKHQHQQNAPAKSLLTGQQQQQQHPQSQPQQQMHSIMSQSIIVQQQVVRQSAINQATNQQQSQTQQLSVPATVASPTNNHNVSGVLKSTQMTPSMAIESLYGVQRNTSKENDDTPVIMPAEPKANVSFAIETSPELQTEEKSASLVIKAAENVSVIRTPPTPNSAKTPTPSFIVNNKEELADSVIKKADKSEANPPHMLSKAANEMSTNTASDSTSNNSNNSPTKNTDSLYEALRKDAEKAANISSTDHDTEDETETKQSEMFESVKGSNLGGNFSLIGGKTPRGGGAKRGRQPRGGKKQAAGIVAPMSTGTVQQPESELGVQTRQRKPLTVVTPTRGRKGRPPRNALLAQKALDQQQQQQQQHQPEYNTQLQQQPQHGDASTTTISAANPTQALNTTAENKERGQSVSSVSKKEQDVYEFHDDSAEDMKISTVEPNSEDIRPHFVITIKSPAQSSPIVKTAEKTNDTLTIATGVTQIETQKQVSDLARSHITVNQCTTQTPIQQQDEQGNQILGGNTRKSRRLQEKDRSTIDDIIEDVVRNTHTPSPSMLALPKGAQTPPRRSGRNVATLKRVETSAPPAALIPNAVGRPRKSKDRKLSAESPVSVVTENTNIPSEQPHSPSTQHQQPQQQQPELQKSRTSSGSVEDLIPKHQIDAEIIRKDGLGPKVTTQTPQLHAQHQSQQISNPTCSTTHTVVQHHPQHPKKKAIAAAEIESYAAAAAAAAICNNQTSISAIPSGGLPMLHTAAPATQKMTGGAVDVMNKSIIDPVTGLISAMQQGKEGSLPLATAAVKMMMPADNNNQTQSSDATTHTSMHVIQKTTAAGVSITSLQSGLQQQQQQQQHQHQLPSPSHPTCSIATPITALTKPVQGEAAAPAATLTVPASLANKPVSVVVKTSTAPPVVIQQQIVQPTLQQCNATPVKQPIVLQQSQLVMHSQHSNVRPPTLKAHVLNSQKQLNLQQATLTPIPSPKQPQQHHQHQSHQQQQPTIVINSTGNANSGPNATSSGSAGHHVIQSNIITRHNLPMPTTASAAGSAAVLQHQHQQHQQLLVNIPPAHSPHVVSAAATQAILNSPRMQPQQTLVIKQGGQSGQGIQSQTSSTQVLHVVNSKASQLGGIQQQPMYSVNPQQQQQGQPQIQHAYIPPSPLGSGKQQQQITVVPIEQPQQHHSKQQQTLQPHITLQQKQPMGVSIVAHQHQHQPSKQQQTLIMPPLGMSTHSTMVLQPKSLSSAMPGHLHVQQLTPSPPGATLTKQNPAVHSLQTQTATPILSSSPPAALKVQQPHASILAGTPSNIRAAIPSLSPQGQARVTPLLLPTGMPVGPFEANMHDMGKYGGTSNNSRPTQSPPPAHQQQASPITPGESAFSATGMRGVPTRENYMIFQQLLRPQESINASMRCGNDYDEKMLGSSPPLELRRPGSVPRTITVPLQSPQDRTSDSPQAAQIYVHNARLPHSHYASDVSAGRGFYDATGRQITIEPPPAHRSATGSSPFIGTPPAVHPPPPPSTPTATTVAHMHPGNLSDRERDQLQREQQERLKMSTAGVHDNVRNMQVATPPHTNQAPPPLQPNTDSLLTLLQRYPVMWQGLLALKTDQAAVQMHFVFGNPHVARASLPCNSDGSTPPLRIAQRMRLEQTQLEGVAKKMQYENEHCMLLALPCGRDHADVLQHSRNLQTGFITYLQQKMAAGIVNIPMPGSEQAAYVVHIFPSCDFANENLERAAPDLKNRVAEIAHLLIVIATV